MIMAARTCSLHNRSRGAARHGPQLTGRVAHGRAPNVRPPVRGPHAHALVSAPQARTSAHKRWPLQPNSYRWQPAADYSQDLRTRRHRAYRRPRDCDSVPASRLAVSSPGCEHTRHEPGASLQAFEGAAFGLPRKRAVVQGQVPCTLLQGLTLHAIRFHGVAVHADADPPVQAPRRICLSSLRVSPELYSIPSYHHADCQYDASMHGSLPA